MWATIYALLEFVFQGLWWQEGIFPFSRVHMMTWCLDLISQDAPRSLLSSAADQTLELIWCDLYYKWVANRITRDIKTTDVVPACTRGRPEVSCPSSHPPRQLRIFNPHLENMDVFDYCRLSELSHFLRLNTRQRHAGRTLRRLWHQLSPRRSPPGVCCRF